MVVFAQRDVEVEKNDHGQLSGVASSVCLGGRGLADDEAKDAYGALVSIVHHKSRQEAGLGMPVALDEIEVFARSFEAYVKQLDELTPEKLEALCEIMRCGVLEHGTPPNLRSGAPALMVIILGEMIRRRGMNENKHDMRVGPGLANVNPTRTATGPENKIAEMIISYATYAEFVFI